MSEPEHVFTVSELTRGVKTLLEAKYPSIWLEGEVSNYRASPAGHRYFTLKDEFAQISAVMFKSARCFCISRSSRGGSGKSSSKRGRRPLMIISCRPGSVPAMVIV